MATRALLFDLDGTVWRGHEWYASILKEISGTENAVTVGRLAAGDNVVQLAKDVGLSREGLISACRARINGLAVYEGVFESLSKLSAAGHKLGIVTSLSRHIAQPALAGLGLERFFEAKKFAARKPSPKPVHAALADLGETADKRHYYVGDTAIDAACAANAGVTFAWASYGYGIVVPTEGMKTLHQFADVVSL